ncbi:hypothetical protein KY326_01445 [Candidatus Woesearchaeota archaeon]|nr:hypothetical protein [Candidatus Woesearchaeota archaeon]
MVRKTKLKKRPIPLVEEKETLVIKGKKPWAMFPFEVPKPGRKPFPEEEEE